MSPDPLPHRPVSLGGRTFQALDLDHPAVLDRVTREMRAGVEVYYDRRWGLTETFCAFLLEHPDLLAGRTVLVAGAGVGLEAVVVGRLAGRVVLNDMAPVALELAAEQLEANGVKGHRTESGSFAELSLDGVELVVACFVVYDGETRDAMARLLERAAQRGVPALLANEAVGPYFGQLLDGVEGPVVDLESWGEGRIVRVG